MREGAGVHLLCDKAYYILRGHRRHDDIIDERIVARALAQVARTRDDVGGVVDGVVDGEDAVEMVELHRRGGAEARQQADGGVRLRARARACSVGGACLAAKLIPRVA